MFKPKFSVAKCKTASGLVQGRLNLLKNKKGIQVRQMKKEIAELLAADKNDNAVIRTEAVIHQEKMIAAFDIMQLFCELLNVRLQLIEKTKEMPSDMRESISSIIFAASRMPEVPELGQLAQQLSNKYGKEFAASASGDETARFVQVNEKLMECLSVYPPVGQAKLDLLAEVAREYNVTSWDYELAKRQLVPDTGAPAGMMLGPPPSEYKDYTSGGGPGSGSWGAGGGGGGGGGGNIAVVAEPAPAAPPAAPEPPSQASWPPQPPPSSSSQPPQELPGFSWAGNVKSDEEIQREYDAAQGPPEKAPTAAMSGGPPSAPPMSGSGSSDLPDPPHEQPSAPLPQPPSAQPYGPPKPKDELDDLQARFNALKSK